MEELGVVTAVCILALGINVPLGYWRRRQPKFSWQWFVAVHISVPVIYTARLWTALDYHWIPLLILGALLGQIVGGSVFTKL